MNASNTIILNAEAGFNTEIVLDSLVIENAATALVAVEGELVLMRAYPLADPTDRLLPESVIEAAADYARTTKTPFKVWAVGELSTTDGKVYLGKTLVGETTNGVTTLIAVKDLIKRCFH